ncbi:MAG: nitroreductase family deazaflavin-dependent oxidoreductase [Anaerolineales bacterium]|nr:nitroreductase family deazaflavin-dependent oxidoreductase [Anaerolineales bacterium]
MAERDGTTLKRKGLMRLFFRAPIALFKARLGWMFGERFLMLTHTGRTSGLPRYVVLEVVNSEPGNGTYYVTSGWGETSDWFQNIQKTPQVKVQVRNRIFSARAERLPVEQAVENLFVYCQKSPLAFRELTGVMLGQKLEATRENCRRLAESVPLVALQPEN